MATVGDRSHHPGVPPDAFTALPPQQIPPSPPSYAPAARVAAPERMFGLGRATLGAVALLIPAVLFRSPAWLVAVAVAAGVVGELVSAWPTARRVYWAVVVAAMLTEVTAVFVSPFTWLLRFGFFLVLAGAATAFLSSQSNDP